ncbi:MAG: InlB B-repeat-containing protein [Clostridia bacterium]|nr:InlB B-repeat-containing protein [Clostridia bacterium]
MKKLFKRFLIALCFAICCVTATAVTASDKVSVVKAESLGAYNVSLNMNEYDFRDNGVATGNGEKYLYLSIEGGESIPYSGDWSVSYTSETAVKVNGQTMQGAMIKTDEKRVAFPLKNSALDYGDLQAGSTITIDGTFANAENSFTVNEVTFVYDGYTWTEENFAYTLEYSGTENGAPQSGLYASMAQNNIPFDAGWSIWLNPCRDDQFVLTSGGTNTAFRGGLCKYGAADWYVTFNSDNNGLYNSAQDTPSEGDVVTFGGWFYRGTDFIYIENAQYQFTNGAWTIVTPTIDVQLNGEEVQGNIISVMPNTETSVVTASSSNGNVTTMYETNAVSDGKFVLRSGEGISQYRASFSVEKDCGVRKYYFTKEMVVRVGFEDFVMEEGASVRVSGDEVNGLRFTAEMSAESYQSLSAQGASFGMVIIPKDYITDGYELTVANLFGGNAKYSETATAGANQAVRKMLHLANLVPADYDRDGKYEVRGAITDILTNNLTREFVGIAYVKLDGEYILASYFADAMDNNARSIYYVAQKAIDANDHASAVQTKYIDVFNKYVSDAGKTYNRTYTVNYITTVNGKSTVETETVTAPLNSVINLTAKEISGFTVSSASKISSKIYANKENVFNFYYTVVGAPIFDSVAWYHPELDGSNNYDNTHNDTVAQTMKEAGFTTVVLGGGDYGVKLNSEANIAVTRTIIDMFYRNGIKSIVWTGNWSDTEEYAFETLPDFSNHEGFAGFFTWDEPKPTTAAMNAVAEYADWYKNAYGEEAAPFKVNLLPSYSYFEDDDYTSYSAYVKAYCDIVLSKFDGTEYTKYLSVDSYPIKADGTMRDTFLYDWAVLKAYAIEYGAEMHAVLQGCGFQDESNGTTYNKAPTEEQMRLQLYTALAFGADSISWWSYYPLNVVVDGALNADGTTTEVYNDLKTVNNELATFGSLFKNYDWKGVIMSSPDSGFFGIGADAQYKAYKKVKDESLFSQYLLSASNTSSFTSIGGSGSNYIVSVMEDADGNEAFVAVNYAAVKDNKTLSLTFKGNTIGQYAIYRNGEMQTVTIGTSGYTLTLAPGEGAFIVAANSEHTVTFKNWDGSVLQEETLSFGSVPEYKGATPTREGFTFTGWTPEIGAISGDTVYTALFEELPKYTITFKNDDETVISSEQYYQGATVVEPATPTKAPVEGEYSYAFAGWDYTVTPANCDATYRATYAIVPIDLTNCELENGGLDSVTNDTNMKSQGSTHSLNIVESISSGNLPFFALTLDKTYDLTDKYMVFDYHAVNANGWIVVLDFVNNNTKLGLWNMFSLNANVSETTHYCEDIGDGWIRVYVNLNSFGASLNNVSRIYATLNAADGSGERNLHFDNLHFVTKPTHTITFKDFDGSVISSTEYELGATVNVPNNPTRATDAGECSYVFAGWDYSVTEVQRNATYTATYTKTDIVDLWNGAVENGGIDAIVNDTADRSENSTYSLNIVESISSGNLPYFAITLDKTYDLTNSYMVFDFKNINRNGWLVVFDFVNNGGKLGLWNMLTLNSGVSADTHYCEDLGNGWIRVYVDVDVLNNSLSGVSKIYATLNASDGSGTLDINFDNLHFEKKRIYTEADDAISGCGLTIVNGGSATVDTSVVSINSVKSAKFNVPAGNSGVWWNYDVDLTKITGSALNMSGKTITFDVKIVGNMTWVGFTVADGNGTYATPNNESYAWMNLSNGWSGFGMSIVSLNDGWYRVSLTPDTSFGSASSNLAKLRFLVNPQDGNEASMYVDNLYLDSVITLPTEADDASSACGLSPVNGGSMTVDTNVYSVFSTQSIKANVPAGNSGAYWNYDLDLISYFGGAMNLSGKTITFDVKIVGNMTWVGFTVADGSGTYATPNNESYAWMNLSNGWSGYGMSIVSLNDGWYRVSLTPDTSFSSASSNIAKLRFLVNPQDANEASMYIDNLYLANCIPTDYIGQCGLVAVNGGSIAKDTEVVSKLSTESVKCTVPAGNNDAWWNYDISLREIAGGTLDLSGQTITFDMKIDGSMGWAGFAVSADGVTYSDYAWTNLSDGWSGYGISVKAIGDGWMRCTVTLDTNFSAYSSAVGVLRFMVHPTDDNQSILYIDNLYLG